MKKPILFIPAILLTICLLTGCAELKDLRQIKSIQEERITELEKQNEQFKDAYYAEKGEREKERSEFSSKLVSLNRDIAELQQNRSQRELKLAEDNTELRRNVQSLQTQLNSTKAEFNQYKGESEKQLASLQSTANETRLAKQKAEKESTDLQKQFDTLRTQLETDQKTVKEKDRTISSLEKEMAEKEGTISSLQSAVSSLETKLEKSRKGSGDHQELKKELEKCREELESARGSGNALSTELKAAEKDFRKAFSTELESGRLRLEKDKRGLIIRLSSDELFESGSVILKGDVKPFLTKIAGLLNKYPQHPLLVEGHTDSIPLENLPFLDNLALSSARADTVLRYLIEDGEIEKSRAKSVACSWFHAAATNKTPEGRKINRRVDIILAPK